MAVQARKRSFDRGEQPLEVNICRVPLKKIREVKRGLSAFLKKLKACDKRTSQVKLEVK